VTNETDLCRRRRHISNIVKYFGEKSIRHQIKIAKGVSLVGLRHEEIEPHLRESELEVNAVESEVKLVALETVDTDDQVDIPPPPFP
jgi:acyl-CoA synthetase (NDP forming)